MRFISRCFLFAATMAFASTSLASAPPGSWVTASLDQIELTPAQGWFTGEGVWFASITPYQTQFDCSNSRYIVIYDSKLADRTLSVALYAKSTGGTVKIYVTGCDSQGYLVGKSVMLVK